MVQGRSVSGIAPCATTNSCCRSPLLGPDVIGTLRSIDCTPHFPLLRTRCPTLVGHVRPLHVTHLPCSFRPLDYSAPTKLIRKEAWAKRRSVTCAIRFVSQALYQQGHLYQAKHKRKGRSIGLLGCNENEGRRAPEHARRDRPGAESSFLPTRPQTEGCDAKQ